MSLALSTSTTRNLLLDDYRYNDFPALTLGRSHQALMTALVQRLVILSHSLGRPPGTIGAPVATSLAAGNRPRPNVLVEEAVATCTPALPARPSASEPTCTYYGTCPRGYCLCPKPGFTLKAVSVVSQMRSQCIRMHQRPTPLRIRWCPSAELSVLPLHAAGLCRKGQQDLPRLYISSCTQTLTALISCQMARFWHKSNCSGTRYLVVMYKTTTRIMLIWDQN